MGKNFGEILEGIISNFKSIIGASLALINKYPVAKTIQD